MSKRPFLGWSRNDRATRLPVTYPGESHLLTIAEPGSGKSRSVAIPNLIHYGGSMVVLDMKGGELTKATALWRAHVLGHDVWVFDPFRIVDPRYLPEIKG